MLCAEKVKIRVDKRCLALLPQPRPHREPPPRLLAGIERAGVHAAGRRVAGAEAQAELVHLGIDHACLRQDQAAARLGVERGLARCPHRRQLGLHALGQAEHERSVQRPPPPAAAAGVVGAGAEAVGLRLEGVGDQVHQE